MQKQQGKSKLLSESIIQTRVKKVYEKAGWLVVKIIQCTLNGWPDQQMHKDGKTIFIECKAEGKAKNFAKDYPLQHHRHQELRAKGFTVHVVDYYLNDIL